MQPPPAPGHREVPSLPPGDVGEGQQSREPALHPCGISLRRPCGGPGLSPGSNECPSYPMSTTTGVVKRKPGGQSGFPTAIQQECVESLQILSRSSHLQSPLHPMQVERMWWGARGGSKDTRELSSHPCPAEHILGHKSYRQWCTLTTMDWH